MSFDRYTIKHSICENCIHHIDCVSPGKRKASQGRCIDRYHTDQAVNKNKVDVENNKMLYKKRQAIVEHPFDEFVFQLDDKCPKRTFKQMNR